MSHDCGPNERHLPVDGSRVCAALRVRIFDGGDMLASPAASDLPAAHASLAESPGESARSFSDLYHSGKRGPPAA